jgi:hypothetical protein
MDASWTNARWFAASCRSDGEPEFTVTAWKWKLGSENERKNLSGARGSSGPSSIRLDR